MTDANADSTEDAESLACRDPGNFFPDGTFNDWLGLTVETYDEGEVVLSVEFEEFKQNPGGILHGGVTASLIDVAGGMAIGTTVEGEQGVMATTNLDVHYLRPITDTAYATAEVVRIGRSNAIAHVEVESTAPSGETKQVAIGTVTYQRG